MPYKIKFHLLHHKLFPIDKIKLQYRKKNLNNWNNSHRTPPYVTTPPKKKEITFPPNLKTARVKLNSRYSHDMKFKFNCSIQLNKWVNTSL